MARKRKEDRLQDYAAAFASLGGKARAKALSRHQRREIAASGARALWEKLSPVQRSELMKKRLAVLSPQERRKRTEAAREARLAKLQKKGNREK